MLSVQNVSVKFGSGAASALGVRDVTLRFEPGDVTLLMGASGSGKTTLLSVMGCLRVADEGSVSMLGRDLSKLGERDLVEVRRKHIGFVFQFFRLFRALSAVENVRLGMELAHDRATGAEELLRDVGLGDKLNAKPEQLSGGERQRVAIARALVKNPEILLADEPTAALDTSSGLRVAELLRQQAHDRGCVAVVATHDSRLIPFADRIVEMRDGAVVRDYRSKP